MNDEIWDVVVVGAGAAGLMAGIAAARAKTDHAPKVLVLDGQAKIGAKILVAGGGRCNVTNEFVDASRFHTASATVPLAKSFVARVLRSFTVEATHRFFREAGVELKLEPTGKYFPVSDSSRTVLNALLDALKSSGAILRTSCRVTALRSENGLWYLRTAEGEIAARALLVCTGGLALPKSGSDGAGLEWARRLGHIVVSTTPALTPLLANPARHAGLSGITHEARLILRAEGGDTAKLLADYTGSFLWTHTGYSGPVALNISRHYAREGGQVFVRLWPEIEDAETARTWHGWIQQHAKMHALNALCQRLPVRVAEMLLATAEAADGPIGKLSPAKSHALRDAVLNLPLPVASVAPYHKAEATAGGVSLDEIESATMMSRLHPGLFFAGEVCDVDGWLGGYNFQWAWSSGTVAGRAAAKWALR